MLSLSCHNHNLYFPLAPPSPYLPLFASFILKRIIFHGGLVLIHLHGNSLDCRSKLVDFYVPLETHKNVGWMGPLQSNHCSR